MENNAAEQQQEAALVVFDDSVKAMMPRNFSGLWKIASIMASSGMMPPGMQKPEAVAVAIQMGLEVGLPPMAAVQNIAVVNGRPSIWGDAVLGLIRASGQLEYISETLEGSGDGLKAVCVCKRKTDPEETRREFSVSDAKQAGLWGGVGDDEAKRRKSPWYKYPKRMLQMRARSWALRDTFGDILRGLQTREEAQDIGAEEMYRQPDGTYSALEKPAEKTPEERAQMYGGDPKQAGGAQQQVDDTPQPEKTAGERPASAQTEGPTEPAKSTEPSSPAASPDSGSSEVDVPGVDHPLDRANWINLKSKGFPHFVRQFAEMIEGSAVEAEMKKKWEGMDIGPWPLLAGPSSENERGGPPENGPEEKPASPTNVTDYTFEEFCELSRLRKISLLKIMMIERDIEESTWLQVPLEDSGDGDLRSIFSALQGMPKSAEGDGMPKM